MFRGHFRMFSEYWQRGQLPKEPLEKGKIKNPSIRYSQYSHRNRVTSTEWSMFFFSFLLPISIDYKRGQRKQTSGKEK